MAKSINYAETVPDIATPVQSQAGALRGSASKLEGEASAIEKTADAGMLSFLGTNAWEAYVGSKKAGASEEIDKVLTDFAKPAQIDPQAGLFASDITRIEDAQKYGTINRTEALLRIADVTKRYSAELPGRAAEFRRIAAEKTGIPNVESFFVHRALTEKSEAEKLAEKKAEMEIKLTQDISSAFGISPSQVTPQDRQRYAEGKQARFAYDRMDAEAKIRALGQDRADEGYNTMLSLKQTALVSDLGMELSALAASNADPAKALASAELGLKLAAKIDMAQLEFERTVRSFQDPSGQYATPLSSKEATRIINDSRGVFNNYKEMVKSVEGRNMLAAMAKASESSVSLFKNNIALANPLITTLNTFNLTTGLGTAYFTMDSKQFEKSFPPDIVGAVRNVMRNPSSYMSMFNNVVGGTPADLSRPEIDPDTRKVAAKDFLVTATDIAKKNDTSEKGQKAFVSLSQSVLGGNSYSTAEGVSEVEKFLRDSNVQKYITTLPDIERSRLVAPMLERLQSTNANVISQIRQEIGNYNNSKTASGDSPGTAAVEMSGLGLLEIKESPAQNPRTRWMDIPGGAATRIQLPGAAVVATQNARDSIVRAKRLVDTLNRTSELYSTALGFMGGEKRDGASVRKELFEAAVEDVPTKPAADVPRNTSSRESRGTVPQTGQAPTIEEQRKKDRIMILEEELAQTRERLRSLGTPGRKPDGGMTGISEQQLLQDEKTLERMLREARK